VSGAAGFAVYIHWPFCETVCPYCDFNVHATRNIDQAAWRDGLIADLANYATDTPGRTVTSVYFGGGTPSLMPPQTAGALIESVSKLWSLSPDAEITIEANPTSAETGRLAAFRSAGINRLSLGIQSFDDGALSFLGRTHTGAEGFAALDRAQEVFERVTFDLMYALPGQSLLWWQAQLGESLKQAAGHLSLYQLTIESGTPFAKQKVTGADEDLAADMFEMTNEVLAEAGMPAYEVSNHARPGEESRHNLTCWRGGDYIGAGPGAHGRVTIDGQTFGTHQIHNPVRWLEKIKTEGNGSAKRRPLSIQDRARECIMMGLRLSEGIHLDTTLADVVDAEGLQQLVDGGLLERDGTHTRTTPAGRLTLNAVTAKLLS
jgi:putative oxygen-independent coproporphyrinogen III oxidase